jgi:hypothetical protein
MAPHRRIPLSGSDILFWGPLLQEKFAFLIEDKDMDDPVDE